jgi:hypothetical protein
MPWPAFGRTSKIESITEEIRTRRLGAAAVGSATTDNRCVRHRKEDDLIDESLKIFTEAT